MDELPANLLRTGQNKKKYLKSRATIIFAPQFTLLL